MNQLVKVISDDDGETIDEPVWHLVHPEASDPATLCTMEYFGYGQSDVVYEEKTVMRGGITCPNCIDFVKALKSVKL